MRKKTEKRQKPYTTIQTDNSNEADMQT